MDTIKCITKSIVMLAISLCITSSALANRGINTFVDAEVEQRVVSMASSIDLKYTAEVKKRIQQYTIEQRSASEVLLGRISIYFPLIEQKLREKGLPDDLKYLAVVESGLRPHAKSRTGATGLWQFMKPTARMHDLKINSVIDERRDPEKSTDAALEYLEYLYNKYGDWALAMGAYNCGPGNMNRAIRKANSTDFWKVAKYLPRETRAYVPKFIAMSYLMNYYYTHDLTPKMPDNQLLNTATSKVLDKVKFKDLSNEYGLDMETIRLLNPTFIRNYIPGDEEDHKLTLPTDYMVEYLNGIESDTPLMLYSYVNGRKRTLSQLREEVRLVNLPTLDIVGQAYNATVAMPVTSETTNEVSVATRLRNRKYSYYTLRSRESLQDVANTYGMTLEDLLSLNNIDEENIPVPGEAIMVND